jgi:hypothetical protein
VKVLRHAPWVSGVRSFVVHFAYIVFYRVVSVGVGEVVELGSAYVVIRAIQPRHLALPSNFGILS